MTRTGKAIPGDGWPLVATTMRAAWLFHTEPDVLEDAVAAAGLAPWGEHASGDPVWRWPELCQVAASVGLAVPTRKGHGWRTRPTIIRTAKQP